MTFDSREFLIFFAVVFAAWMLIRYLNRPVRNGFLLVASYFFYGFWSPPFVLLLMTSTVVDFFLGRAIAASDDKARRKQLVGVSVIVNLGILGFFKYFDFFIDSALMVLPEGSFAAPALEVILPVGISFYTFQSMSYSIDVYRKHIKPADSFIDFALYVAFFPQLVAGPIERAGHMLPQFAKLPRIEIDRTIDGIDLCVRGFFKKVVIADNVAPLVNLVFADVDSASSMSLWIASYAFSIQVYADFSGYTDIARGSAKMFGFELMENFRAPFRSLNVSELWTRWHISLSSWFRDYLFVPLGGFRRDKFLQLRALFLVMALGGLWHGAAWNFVLWGLFHGVLLVIHHLCLPALTAFSGNLKPPGLRLFRFGSWFLTFHLVVLGFTIFRAQSLSDIGTAFYKMLVEPVSDLLANGFVFVPGAGAGEQTFYLLIISAVILLQFTEVEERISSSGGLIRRGMRGATALVVMFIFYPSVKEQFIYFQF